MRILMVAGAMVLALAGAMPADAQTDFETEVLRRLERLERRMDELERGGGRRNSRNIFSPPQAPPPSNEVVAATSQLCGANCGMAAQTYCRGAGYRNGVAINIEKRGPFEYVTRARCFN